MSFGVRRALTLATIVLLALSSAADAQSKRRSKKQVEAPPPSTPVDKRDRLVNAPGTPFTGRAYWQAAAQCGGIYFKLGTLHSDAAVRAKTVEAAAAAAKPCPELYQTCHGAFPQVCSERNMPN